MAHLQQQVLDAIKAVLLDETDAGPRVHVDRVDPLKAKQLPAILIAEGEGGEEAAPATIAYLESRTLNVTISCVVKDHDGAAAECRALGLAVEKLLSAETPPAGLQALCALGWRISSSRLAQSGEGDELFAARVQAWQFSYLVNPATPDVVA